MTIFDDLKAQLEAVKVKLSDAHLETLDVELFSAPDGVGGPAIFYGGRVGDNVGLIDSAGQIAESLGGYWIEQTEGGQTLAADFDEADRLAGLVEEAKNAGEISTAEFVELDEIIKSNEARWAPAWGIVSEKYAVAAPPGVYVLAGNNVDPEGIAHKLALIDVELPVLLNKQGTTINGFDISVWNQITSGDANLTHSIMYSQTKSAIQAVGGVDQLGTLMGADALRQAVHEYQTSVLNGRFLDQFLLDESAAHNKTYHIFGGLDAKALAVAAGFSFATLEWVHTLDALAEAAEKGGVEGFLEELEAQAIYWGAGIVIALSVVALAPEIAAIAVAGLTIVDVGSLIAQMIDGVPGDPISDLASNIATVLTTLIDLYHEGQNNSLPPISTPDPIPSQVTSASHCG